MLLDVEEDSENLVAGDLRATEQPGLTSLHSLFLNEHNRIATELSELDRSLTDEELYQISRQIVIAELQNIVYNEFLPVVLGSKIMEEHNISLPLTGPTKYDKTVDPRAINEFATFAFRFGHTMVPHSFKPYFNFFDCPIKDNFFNFEQFNIGRDFSGKAWQDLLYSIHQFESPHFDGNLNDHLTNFLFCGENCRLGVGFGQDLAARNIQRGRDHGLPGYVNYREPCGLSSPADWSDKPEEISEENWGKLQEVYNNVEDIDAFSGAFSEDSVSDGLVGPTIACIIGIQFRNLMIGDRFFFTHSNGGTNQEQGLIDEARIMIRQRRLSDIICDNLDVGSLR